MPPDRVSLHLPKSCLGFFIPLLGEGVGVQAPSGISLDRLLCDQLGIARDYLRDRIQTIFVNGRAIDRPEAVVIGPEAVVALSAAMPGLVGATLRRGGHLAAMRREISQGEPSAAESSGGQGWVRLKLFNMVARETGAQILERGVWIEAGRFSTLWARMAETVFAQARTIRCNEVLLDAETAAAAWSPKQAGYVLLNIHFEA